MSLYPLSNTWDTKYVTVSNTWARKDTVTSYFTKYTLCIVPHLDPHIILREQFNIDICGTGNTMASRRVQEAV